MGISSSLFADRCPVGSASNNSLALRRRSLPRNGFSWRRAFGRLSSSLHEVCQSSPGYMPNHPYLSYAVARQNRGVGAFTQCQRSKCRLAPNSRSATPDVSVAPVNWTQLPASGDVWLDSTFPESLARLEQTNSTGQIV